MNIVNINIAIATKMLAECPRTGSAFVYTSNEKA